jgi:hypothetical protein
MIVQLNLAANSAVRCALIEETIESKNKLLWPDSRAMRHCATVRLRRYSKRRSRSKVRRYNAARVRPTYRAGGCSGFSQTFRVT